MLQKIPFALLSFFLLISASFAQKEGNLEIFSKNGERFYLILNGQQMHQNAETNVKLKDLNPERYKLKVIFEDSAIGTLDKNVIVKPAQEFTYIIRKNLFDNYAIKPYSKRSLASGQGSGNKGSPGGSGQGQGQGQKKGDSGKSDDQGGQHGKGMPAPQGHGVSISVDINSSDGSFNTSVKTKTSTHHSHTQTGTQGSMTQGGMKQGEDAGQTGSASGSQEEPEDEGPLPDYNGPTGCQNVMSESRFREAKSSIEGKSFADSRMTQAKRMTKNNCLLTDQVQEILQLFSFEDDRLEYAKFAHDHTYDQGNYYKIHDSFEFSSTIDELDQYLEKK